MHATFHDTYGSGKFGLSFELFPPKTPAGERALFRHVAKLMEFDPAYITCTYGAGGSTQNKTLDIAARVHEEHKIPVASHLTCVGRTADQLRDYLKEAAERGVYNVVALRGDPPAGEENFKPIAGGFSYANELVEMIRRDLPGMGIAVGGYPETHQEALNPKDDLDNLKRKVDAGSDVIITQLFYDNADFFRFRDDCVALGINIPIVPGLLPITNFAQVKRISSLCGAKLPAAVADRMEAAGDDTDAQFDIGVEFASQQTQELLDAGVEGLHFYVLNKSEATSRVLEAVSRPA